MLVLSDIDSRTPYWRSPEQTRLPSITGVPPSGEFDIIKKKTPGFIKRSLQLNQLRHLVARDEQAAYGLYSSHEQLPKTQETFGLKFLKISKMRKLLGNMEAFI